MCEEAFDSTTTGAGNGWAYGARIPTTGTFTLASEAYINGIDLLSGVAHRNQSLSFHTE